MLHIVRNIKLLVELFAYLYCLAKLFGKHFRISIQLVVFIILEMILLIGINDYGFPEYFSSLTYMGLFLYSILYYQENIKLTLVNCFLAAVIVAITQLLLFPPLYFLFYVHYELVQVNELLINAGCLIIIFLCDHKIKLKKLSDIVIKRNKLIVGTSVLILFGLGISFYQMKIRGEILKEIYIQMVYFILIFLFVIYEWQKSKMDVEKKKTQLEMNQLYYDAYDHLILLVRQRQHDMKTHISTIRSMIFTTDNYDELVAKQKEYCDYVMDENEKNRLVLSVDNPLIAGFLYSKIQEANGKGIEVEYYVSMRKESIIIPEYELIEMSSILVDNAIEALCNPSMDTDEQEPYRKICITIKETYECVELIVANTSNRYEEDMTERFFENGYSNKGKDRGIGLSKLKRFVHDRKGDIIVSNELNDERNYLTFTIKIPKEKK